MITFDKQETETRLSAILFRAEDLVPVFDFIGDRIVGDVKERIKSTKLSPDGEAWAPWRPFTADMRSAAGNEEQGLLWDTGDLLDSIAVSIDGSFELAIGTDVAYAQELQEGIAGKQIARPFLGWEADDAAAIVRSIHQYIGFGRFTW